MLQGIGDADLAVLLGVHSQTGPEAEQPDCLLMLWPGDDHKDGEFEPPRRVLERMRSELTTGRPNTLSSDHHDWPIIDDVAAAATRPHGDTSPGAHSNHRPTRLPPDLTPRQQPARTIIRARRSAVSMDGETTIPRETFYRMLGRLDASLSPFSALPWEPAIHLAIFVHRVEGLEPGLYILVRNQERTSDLRSALRNEFRWSRPAGCPETLGLWTLAVGACDQAARRVSCGQDIASDGAFALGMLAEFAPRLKTHGPWFYRCLHWEAGMIGQALYLDAGAAGVGATGIGCFLDDLMHEMLGVESTDWRTLYHFTIGGGVDDPRLRTLGAYDHLEE